MTYVDITGHTFDESKCTVTVESNEPLIAIDMWYTVYEYYTEYFNGTPVEQKITIADEKVMIQPGGTYKIVFSYNLGLKYRVEVGVFSDVYNGTGDKVTEDYVEFYAPSTPPQPTQPGGGTQPTQPSEGSDYVIVKVLDSSNNPVKGATVELFRCDVPWPISCPYTPYGALGLEPGYRLISTKTTDSTGIAKFTGVNKDYDYAIAVKYGNSVKYQFRLTEPDQFNKTYTVTISIGGIGNVVTWFSNLGNTEKTIVIAIAAVSGLILLSSLRGEKVVVVR